MSLPWDDVDDIPVRGRDAPDEAFESDREVLRRLEDALDRERALRRRMSNMRRALRQLNKAHATLWKVIGLQAEKIVAQRAEQEGK